MAKKWGLPPENPDIIPEKKPKKIVKEKPPVDDFADLIDKSRIAELKQEILKAEQLEYKNEREKIKLMQESQELVKFDLAEFLFFGFMEKTNNEILRLLRKIEPVIKDLCQENQPIELINRLTHDLEAIIKDIKKQQKQTVKKWKSEV